MRVAPVILFVFFVLGAGGDFTVRAASFSGAIVFERDVGQSSDLYVSSAPGEATPLVATPAQEFHPALSRSGRLAFVRAGEQSADIVALVDGREIVVTDDGATDGQPAWSPDEETIAFASDSGSGFDIKAVRIGDPRSVRTLAPSKGDDIDPAYSPDGHRLVFASNRSGNWELYLLVEERRLIRLTRTAADETNAAWSPDARRLAYTLVDAKGNSEIYVLTLATGAVFRVTRSAASDYDPAWSPTGAELAFVSDREGEPAIWVVPAKGGRATRVSRPVGGIDLGPAWGGIAPEASARTPAVAQQGIVCPESGSFAGTAGNDTINGTVNDDVICGRDGADTLRGGGGRDKLAGGNHGDFVYGGDTGDEVVAGGAGVDRVEGNAGDDTQIVGGSGADRMLGGEGNDKLFNQDASSDVVDCGLGTSDRRQPDSGPADSVSNCEGWI
jgi:hypothetical protein